MNETQTKVSAETRISRSWSNRILIAALGGIFFLTLYPFEFSLHTTLAGRSPFLLGSANKGGGGMDVFLNVLLFMPFGFGLAAKLSATRMSWISRLIFTWGVGVLLSYGIEFLQLYIPARDSGWEDVFSNSTGAALGCLLFLLIGTSVLRVLSSIESAVQEWLPPRRAFLVLGVCFAAWAVYSIHLQGEAHFQSWSRDSFLVFGNDATGRRPWKGTLVECELWDRALDSASAQKLTEGNVPSSIELARIASFDFSSLPPRQENVKFLIPLSPTPMHNSSNEQGSFSEPPLIASSRPVSELIADLQQTNQFSIRVVFAPDDIAESHGRIVSISSSSGIPDLFIGQNEGNLVFWFRNKLSVQRPGLAWEISKLLAPHQTRDLLFSFDGSDIRLYAGGRKLQDRYWGAGTSFASLFRHVKQGELNGYRDLFYAVVFVPIGCLFGLAARKLALSNITAKITFGFSLLLAPLILECELTLLDSRAISLRNGCLSFAMIVAGILWINADRSKQDGQPDYVRP